MSEINIDLFGWDTTYAISYTKANQAIKDLKATPDAFTYESKNGKGEVVGSITGNWNDWQLTTKGDGQNITMKCPIKSGTFSDLMDQSDFKLDNTWVEVEVELNFIEQESRTYFDPTAKKATGTQHNLLAKTKSSDPESPVASIVANNFSFSEATDPDISKAICVGLFVDWFTNHLDSFTHIFSIFVINDKADKDEFQWLKPTKLQYATSSTSSLDTSVFGVLAKTENRPIGIDTHSVDARMLAEAKADSVFAIAGERFAEKWLLPGCLNMRLGSKAADYQMSGDGLSFENDDHIQWATFEDKNGDPVPAKIDKGNFKVTLVTDEFKVAFTDLYWDAEPGVTIHVDYTEYYGVELKSGTDKKGKPYKNVLVTTQKSTPSLQVTMTKATWKEWTDIGVEIGIAILGSLVGGLVGAAADAASAGATAAVEGAAETGENVTIDLTEALADVMSESDASMETISLDASEDASSDMSEASEMEEAGESSETIASKIAGKARSFGKWMWGTKWKLVGSVVGGGIGATLGAIPQMIEAVEKEYYSDLPSFDEFGDNCIGSVKWPNSSGFELESAQLQGALLLGGKLIEEETK